MRICDDVLLVVFSYGDRRCLGKLEQHGTRFKYHIGRYFPEKPFLLLDMDFWIREKKEDEVL